MKPQLWLIKLLGVIVPRRLRADWRLEWEAELRSRELLLAEWDRLDWRGKLDLLRRSTSAFWDALLLQPKRLEDEMFQDLRYGVRMMLKHPGLTAVVAISLAVGIGANTTIFSYINALLLRPPAVRDPGSLLEVMGQSANGGSSFERSRPLNYPDYVFYRDNNRVFTDLVGYDGDPIFAGIMRNGQAETVLGQFVSGNYFTGLGVQTARGRAFSSDDDAQRNPVVVLSHEFWRQTLASDPNVVGTSLVINGVGMTVVGVAPEGFRGMMAGFAPVFFAPLSMKPQITRAHGLLEGRESFWLMAVGRLQAGVSAKQAQSELSVLAQQLQQAYPNSNKDLDVAVYPAALVPGPFRVYVGAFTGLLMIVVGLVLLVACANAANLFLASAVSRRRETAIRAALGASRSRIIRQALTESVAVAMLGGLGGLAFALWSVPALLKFAPPALPIKLDVPIDHRVLSFTFLTAILTGVIFGILPAMRSARLDLTPSLKDGASGSGYRRSRLRSFLVVSQIAVCTVLLVAGGLCLRSLLRARTIDAGFEVENRVAVSFDLKNLDYNEERGKVFYSSLLERAGRLPGVKSAAIAGNLPLGMSYSGDLVNFEGVEPPPGEKGFSVGLADVGPNYFLSMGTPLLAGREFNERDNRGGQRVVIINDAIAQRLWPGQNPIGRYMTGANPAAAGGDRYEVIGVVKTGKYRTLSEAPRMFLYRSILQHYHSKTFLVVNAAGDPGATTAALRDELRALDPNLAPTHFGTLSQHMALALFPARVLGTLLAAFGLLALALAIIGLTGVVAYTVSQRTQEIGVRMALGARSADVMWLVVRQGLGLAGIGLALGMGAAFGLTRFLESLLYGVKATDPLTFIGVIALLAAATLLACYLPARRAARTDPLTALRHD